MTLPFNRRRFLQGLAPTLGVLSLATGFPRLVFAAEEDGPAEDRDILVCLFLRGGADGLSLIVPHGDQAYYDARPGLAIGEPVGGGTSDRAIDLDGFFGLHPALAPLGELYDDGLLAAVHAVGAPDGSHSHFDAMDTIERGVGVEVGGTVRDGWIGRHLASLDPTLGGSGGLGGLGGSDADSPFRAVGFGTNLQTSLRGPVPATALQSIAEFHLGGAAAGSAVLERFQASLAALYTGDDAFSALGRQTLDAIELLDTAALDDEPKNGASYPESELGSALSQVATLIRAELGLEVACVDAGGWDTHDAQGTTEGRLPTLLTDLGSSLHAFATDLADRLDRLTVVVMTEFGRRVDENASAGTDHGGGSCMWLLGGGVRGGKVYGTWPGLAPEQLSGPGDLAVTTDYRTVLAELVDRRLANTALGEVFPGFDPPAYLGLFR